MNSMYNNERQEATERDPFLDELQPTMKAHFVEKTIEKYAREKKLNGDAYYELYRESLHQIENRGSIQLPNQSEGEFTPYDDYRESLENCLAIVGINPLLRPIDNKLESKALQQKNRELQMRETVLFAEGMTNHNVRFYTLPDGRRVLESKINPDIGRSIFPNQLRTSALHNVFGLELKTDVLGNETNNTTYETITLPPKPSAPSRTKTGGVFSLIED